MYVCVCVCFSVWQVSDPLGDWVCQRFLHDNSRNEVHISRKKQVAAKIQFVTFRFGHSTFNPPLFIVDRACGVSFEFGCLYRDRTVWFKGSYFSNLFGGRFVACCPPSGVEHKDSGVHRTPREQQWLCYD